MSVRRPWAWPLMPLYGAALAAGEALRAAGIRRERRLRWPVISVGSLSAGGAGKTPVTMALADLLSDRGWTVDVLSRGYGRAGRGVEAVDLRAADPARQFGDEPTLIAQRTGVPVWVGADRFTAGSASESRGAAKTKGAKSGSVAAQRYAEGMASGSADALGSPNDSPNPDSVAFVISTLSAETETNPRVHLLDDGFQHRALARSFDLALVTAEDFGDSLLPSGNLREPLSALRRADALAVREEESSRVMGPLRAIVGREVPVWTIRRTLRFNNALGVFGAGLRPLAFCGIARPENFAAMLTGAGCGLVDTVLFPDHHRYGERDIQELIRLAKSMNASGFVTTEKDAVKLNAATVARLQKEVGPLVVPALHATFVYESPVVRALASRLQATPVPARALGDSDEVRSR